MINRLNDQCVRMHTRSWSISVIAILISILLLELMLVGRVMVHADASRTDVRLGSDTPDPSVSSTAQPSVSGAVIPPPPSVSTPSAPAGPAAPSTPQTTIQRQVWIPVAGGTTMVPGSSTTTPILSFAGTSISGFGAAGHFVKCEILAQHGWPLPLYLVDCTGTSTPPTPPPNTAILSIIKHAIGGNATFGFTIGGVSPGTTSVTTSSGTGGVNLIVSPGITSVSEDPLADDWALIGIGCTLNGTTTGFALASTTWQLTLAAGAHATCDFTNTFSGGVGGGGDDGDGGGGGGPPSGGGGGPPSGGGSSPPSGGGGSPPAGNGPIAGSLPPAGTGNVLGTSTPEEPGGMGGYVPDMPDTGAGGDALMLASIMLAAFAGMVISGRAFVRGLWMMAR